MNGMSELPSLTWGTFFGTWHVPIGWSVLCAAAIVGYLLSRRRAGAASTVRPWRAASFVVGVVLTWACLSSAVGVYAMALFWMHMVLHLTLITAAPAFLVLGHPLTVVIESLEPPRRDRALAVLRSRPVGVLTHPLTGLVLYTATIIGTHLTGFMDQMAHHDSLMVGEQVLYLVAGYLFLLPLIGEEAPLRSDLSYGGRMILLVAGMIPDTIVGIVLLQSDVNPFPVFARMRPSWAPDALDDVQTAGGLMWAGGDGLMMVLAVAVMLAAITTESRRERIVGPWLQGVRRTTLAGHGQSRGVGNGEAGNTTAPDLDPDSDEALEAYNRMLAGLNRRQR